MAARRPESPTHIGPYRVLRPMGSGGMAHVYAVEDPATGRNRAVKLLTRRGMAWTRFEREYRALARMDHPNIVRVFRFGVTDKRQPYLVMELLEGLPIQEWASGFGEVGDPERVEATVRALAGVADALEYLHRRGFIHRDLKSNNVLVLPDGTAKLLDFGATRGVGPDASSITRFGEFVGTYTYASPEQIDGDEQDARSDVYSLGVLAYRVLCGRPPFEADSILAITRMHFEQAPDPPHERVPSLPLPISGLVLEMLAKQPRERVQSAGEVADRLRWSNSTQVVLDQDEATNELTTSPSLVGRRQALRAVQATLERARPGRMVLVIGAPGGGRHRIMKEARALASSAGFLLYRAELDDAGALDLTSLGNDTTPLPDPRTFLAALERHNRAAVLFCRDLHDASPEALESIKLIRQGVTHKGTPLLVFASLLSSEDNPAIRLAFMDASRISLRPLTVGEVGTLMASMLGEGSIPTQTVNHVAEATGGQPGFVREMVGAMAAQGLFVAEPAPGGRVRWRDRSEGSVAVPRTLRRETSRLISSQPRSALRPLMAVALAGEVARPTIIAKALGADEAAIEASLSNLQSAGILSEPDTRGLRRFRVQLMGQVLLEKLSAKDRRHLERLLAAALPGARPCMDAVRILAAAGRDEPAQLELIRCWRACRSGHSLANQLPLVGSVVSRAVRSKRCPPAILARLELCWARALATGDPDDERVDEALDRARDLVISPDIGAELEMERARVHGRRGESRKQERSLKAADTLLETVGDDGLRSAVLLEQSAHALRTGRVSQADELAAQSMAVAARGKLTLAEGLARVGQAQARVAAGRLEAAEHQLVAARAKLSRDTDGRSTWLAERALARLFRRQGRLSEALAMLDRELDAARVDGAPPRILGLTTNLVVVKLDLFRLGEAREHLAELEDMGLSTRHPLLSARLALARGRLALATGEPAGSVEALGDAVSSAHGAGLEVAANELRACLGESLALSGDPARGDAACHQAVRGLEQIGLLPALAEACASQARALGQRGDPAGCFRPVLPWLQEHPMRLVRMDYLLTSAEQAVSHGDWRGAHYGFQDARTLADKLLQGLAPEDRAAFQIHPWFRRIERGESQGRAWKGRR